jgi:hypothetical protein
MLAATRGTLAQVRGGGGDVEHWGRGFPFAGSGGATGDSEEIDELVLNRDHGLGGGDSILGRGAWILGEVPEVPGNPAESEHHLGRESCPGNR